MGQQQSTRNGRRNTDSNQTRPDDTTQRSSVANSQLSAPASASTGAQSPPVEQQPRVKGRSISQTFRRSVIGLVKPSTSHSEDDDDGSRQQQKKWRRSRRWSKAPLSAGLHGGLSDTAETGVARNETAEGSGSAQLDENQQPPMATSSSSSANNPPSLANDMSNREEPGSSGRLLSETSTSNESNPGDVAVEVTSPTASTPTAVGLEAPVSPPQPATQPVPIPPRVQSQAIPNPTAPVAQFPPAGTLVVVQGVVHTSDTDRAPRPPVQARPRSRTPVSPRRSNILTGLLRRGNSTSSLTTPSSRDSILDSASTHSAQGTRTPSDDAGASESTASGDSVTSASDAAATPQTSSSVHALSDSSPTAQGPAPDNLDGQRNSLSSNSLDVLGALLSVATAATAASLLSAPTSRPPPVGSDPNQAPSQEAQNAIPALARALANANPAAAAALLQHDSATDREEQERNRVRHLWDNLRQRLVNGRGRNQPPQLVPAGAGAGAGAGVGAGAAPTRPGGEHAIPDALFSELARAFNLNHPHDDMQADEPFEDQLQRVESGDMPVPEEETRMEEAPPGSFERFLVDLQVDLRTALSRTEGEGEAGASTPSREPSSTPTIVVNAPATPAPEIDPREPQQEHRSREAVLDISGSATQGTAEANNTEGSDSSTRRTESEPVNDNEPNSSSSTNGGGNSTASLPLPPLSSASVLAGASDQGPAATNQRTNTQRGGISWWRTYRFPPMRLNPPPRPQTATTQPANPPSSTTSGAPGATSTQESGIPTTTTQSGTAPTAASELPQEHIVVPVIVVGLQSINGPRIRPNGTQRTTPSAPPQAGSETAPSTPTAAQQQQDGWRSRAARAFGGIGRRSASADPPESRREPAAATAESGSRTFFIYVFGGYYPPNHHMVTGSGNLDSFEALWELAELLGPAKPPVATESEIENSGLEVFKAKLVTDYETAGRVSNNCVDKCLICLDDYEDEDDLRLLSCKHAFHRNCVDHWLKNGRNNCPACRSTGVKTGDEVPGASSTTSTA